MATKKSYLTILLLRLKYILEPHIFSSVETIKEVILENLYLDDHQVKYNVKDNIKEFIIHTLDNKVRVTINDGKMMREVL